MKLLHYRRLVVLIMAAMAAATSGAALAAGPNLYFGAKGGVMSADTNGYGDSWNAGGLVGMHLLDLKGRDFYGNLSGEIELTAPVIKGDINIGPASGKWSTWTIGAFAVYRSPELNHFYFKGKAGAAHRNVTNNVGGSPGRGSSDDPAFGVGVGYTLNRRHSIEAEVTVMDTLTFISAGFVF